jgi:hypothetical protein
MRASVANANGIGCVERRVVERPRVGGGCTADGTLTADDFVSIVFRIIGRGVGFTAAVIFVFFWADCGFELVRSFDLRLLVTVGGRRRDGGGGGTATDRRVKGFDAIGCAERRVAARVCGGGGRADGTATGFTSVVFRMLGTGVGFTADAIFRMIDIGAGFTADAIFVFFCTDGGFEAVVSFGL